MMPVILSLHHFWLFFLQYNETWTIRDFMWVFLSGDKTCRGYSLFKEDMRRENQTLPSKKPGSYKEEFFPECCV